jgi:alpha,alpha-trehalose-phosphate synthase [UDP-forming]
MGMRERNASSNGARVVAYANRLPVTRTARGWRPSVGGLVAALQPALDGRGAWVGWDGGSADVPRRIDGIDIDLCPVPLARREVDDYYHGFANRTLWPLLHGAIEEPVYDGTWWRSYKEVNERFAEAVVPNVDERAFRWVHDYQLMLVPWLLRSRQDNGGPIGFFLHVPFPPPEVFARLPWRQQVLHGLLGADTVSFHTDSYRENFVRSCLLLRDDLTADGTTLKLGKRTIRTAAHPISIDTGDIARRATRDTTTRFLHALQEQFAGRRVLLGVDRLDYSKGIIERLRAIEMLLDRRPDLRRQLAFIQIAVPSRGEIREYRDLRRNVEEMVGRINGRFTDPGHDVPIHYLHRGVNRERLLAYYLLADVCLVTPLADGMNLVAKEFVVAQHAAGGSGALVLSEFAGAAAELPEALPCNPFDIAGLTGMIEVALELDEDNRRDRLERMAATIEHDDVHTWLERELGEG